MVDDNEWPPERLLTKKQFCDHVGISTNTYARLARQGLGPLEFALPGSTALRITHSAVLEWRKRIEKYSASEEARVERARRSEIASISGRKGAASPDHISKQRKEEATLRLRKALRA